MSFIPSTFGSVKSTPWQPSFDELGRALIDTTFVVVDLETTGGSHSSDAITEIGAVKIRGGEIIGEFQTLINQNFPFLPSSQYLIESPMRWLSRRPRFVKRSSRS